MNKGQSATVGAILLAGAMFRSGSSSAPQPPLDSPFSTSQVVAAQTIKPASGDGPWLASCKYWTSARWDEPQDTESSPDLPAQTEAATDPHLTRPVQRARTECEREGDGWGIPVEQSLISPAKLSSSVSDPSLHKSAGKHPTAPLDPTHQPDIRAIIAAVPDPIHSHLALEFDRTIDALMQAGANNGYLGSDYWLPWRNRGTAHPSAEASNAPQTDADRKREQQPGLIVLKYSPKLDENDDKWSSYHRVIYLFLVAETPALGMDGRQLRNALRYEAMLQDRHHARLSMGDQNQLAIIGPRSSGSAASLREGIETAKFSTPPSEVIAAGATSTRIAVEELTRPGIRPLHYVSFGESINFEEDTLVTALEKSAYDPRRIAVLVEDGTVFGQASAVRAQPHESRPLYIRFPREISLLRNAQTDQGGKQESQSAAAAPTPYLNLSLKDSNADDTVPHFSAQTPLSQEAQLMSIAHQLQRHRTQFILVTASSILDEFFLAQFLHRACPDARLVFYNGGDLLVERDVDNEPYIGSITITPYDLSVLGHAADRPRAFSDSISEGVYNAASYVFWYGTDEWKKNVPPKLADYRQGLNGNVDASLWATAIGSDGYYPLGILNPCANNSASIMPSIVAGHAAGCDPKEFSFTPSSARDAPSAYPSLLWFVLCILIMGLCIGHAGIVISAQYWSPFTRDLAIRENDQPRRRAVYVNIGTSVLVSMAFIVAFPLFPASQLYHADRLSFFLAICTLLTGIAALVVTLIRTLPYVSFRSAGNSELPQSSPTSMYFYFNVVALVTVISVPAIWAWICLTTTSGGVTSYVGPFFSYRSLYPGSGVSPVVPPLLLLFSWYLWSILQTARLRFSTMSRPRLPDKLTVSTVYPFFVSDTELSLCSSPTHSCLYENITCLLITREIVRRFTLWSNRRLNAVLGFIYFFLFLLCIFSTHIQSLERFLLQPRFGPTAYELLIAALFFPLIMIALTGWLRMIFVWGALSRGLLEPLERMPIRLAFSRLREVGWMTMLSQSGLHIRWRDMSRSAESIRQLVNNPELKVIVSWPDFQKLKLAADDLVFQVQELRAHMGLRAANAPPGLRPQPPMEFPRDDHDLPDLRHRRDLCYIYAIEKRYAAFCEIILSTVLIPFWNEKRIGFVEEAEPTQKSDNAKAKLISESPRDPLYIQLAEELLVVRYVALIRTVLVNVRYLMLFTSAAFVFAIIAWNSYPFQPHQLINWCFTILLVFLGSGFIWVFAQMHRNPILSRITDTTPNELGIDFYFRILSFGAVPVITWIAYQFPNIGSSLFKILQPGLQIMK